MFARRTVDDRMSMQYTRRLYMYMLIRVIIYPLHRIWD